MLSRTLKDGFRANEQRTILLLLLVCRRCATRESRKARPDAQHGRAVPELSALNQSLRRSTGTLNARVERSVLKGADCVGSQTQPTVSHTQAGKHPQHIIR